MTQTFTIIAAMDQNRGLGKDNSIPWRLKEDMVWFKAHTSTVFTEGAQNMCIMGRKTWESLPESFRPLPNRLNVVVSRNADYELPEGVLLAASLEEALSLADNADLHIEHTFVIGGGQLYQEAIQHDRLERLILTTIWETFDCDCFFPEFNNEAFVGTYASNCYSKSLNYSFKTFQRR